MEYADRRHAHGHKSDGRLTEGKNPPGYLPDGDHPCCHLSDGDNPRGELPDGEPPEDEEPPEPEEPEPFQVPPPLRQVPHGRPADGAPEEREPAVPGTGGGVWSAYSARATAAGPRLSDRASTSTTRGPPGVRTSSRSPTRSGREGFIQEYNALGPDFGAAALLVHHAAATGAGNTIDKRATLPFYRLLCTTFPLKDRSAMCHAVSIIRGSGAAVDKKRTAAKALADFLQRGARAVQPRR